MMQYVWMVVAGLIAFGKGRGIVRWVFATYFFGFFAPAVLMFLSVKTDALAQRQERISEWAAESVTKDEFKDVETVDVLFKQLETK